MQRLHQLFMVGILATSLCSALLVSNSDRSLFAQSHVVIDMASNNIEGFSPTSKACPWVILYYDSNCGHCRAFAPTYEAIAAAHHKPGSASVVHLFGAINCVDEEPLCRSESITDFPTLKLWSPFDKKWSVLQIPKNLEDFDTALSVIVGANQLESSVQQQCTALATLLVDQRVAKLQKSNKTGVGVNFKQEKKFHQQDVANAFFFTMWHEASMGIASPQARRTLKIFLGFVAAAMPDVGALPLLKVLEDSLTIDPFAWKQEVEKANIPYAGSKQDLEWKTCKGSSWQYRGFTCGMWLLYHSVLSSLATKDVNSGLYAIKEYVTTFFTCGECRQHFGNFTIPFPPQDVEGSKGILWLWRTHNAVNQRLAQTTDGEDPQVPKVQFPTKEDCFPCYSKTPTPGESPFIEGEVVQYLVDRYKWKPSFLKTDKKKPDIVHHNLMTASADGFSDQYIVVMAIATLVLVLFVSYKSLGSKQPVKQRASWKRQRDELLASTKAL